jgi:hypothetical protein
MVLIYDMIGRLIVQKTVPGLAQYQLIVPAKSQIVIVQLNNTQGQLCQKIFIK